MTGKLKPVSAGEMLAEEFLKAMVTSNDRLAKVSRFLLLETEVPTGASRIRRST